MTSKGTMEKMCIRDRGRAHHRADLHALGGVAGVVDFIHQPRCQADLVAVGAVPRRRRGGQHALGQLACDGVLHRLGGVGRAGDAHGLIAVSYTHLDVYKRQDERLAAWLTN